MMREQSLEKKVDMLLEENKKLNQNIKDLNSKIVRIIDLYSELESVPEARKKLIQKVKKM